MVTSKLDAVTRSNDSLPSLSDEWSCVLSDSIVAGWHDHRNLTFLLCWRYVPSQEDLYLRSIQDWSLTIKNLKTGGYQALLSPLILYFCHRSPPCCKFGFPLIFFPSLFCLIELSQPTVCRASLCTALTPFSSFLAASTIHKVASVTKEYIILWCDSVLFFHSPYQHKNKLF